MADELDVTRAATRLNTSQPSLSLRIRQFESEIGVALLDRSRHHVALTGAGRVFLRETKDILSRIEHAGRLAKQAAGGRAGDLSVGTFPAADVRILPEAFTRTPPTSELLPLLERHRVPATTVLRKGLTSSAGCEHWWATGRAAWMTMRRP